MVANEAIKTMPMPVANTENAEEATLAHCSVHAIS